MLTKYIDKNEYIQRVDYELIEPTTGFSLGVIDSRVFNLRQINKGTHLDYLINDDIYECKISFPTYIFKNKDSK
jgi:hypothetical protein